ncbi:hypothetical protein [Pannonibacter phragmitetus]|nr:hypothetical protein [Pannonibacter phragmitetus]
MSGQKKHAQETEAMQSKNGFSCCSVAQWLFQMLQRLQILQRDSEQMF